MQVFKTFFKMLYHYRGTVILYLCIFLGVSLAMSSANSVDSRKEFENTGISFGLVDEEQAAFGEAVREYFGGEHEIKELAYDEEKIKEALYWKEISYVLVIPKGFTESLLSGQKEKIQLKRMKVPGAYESDYFEAELDMYLSKLTGFLEAGYNLEEAAEELNQLKKEDTKVRMASFVNADQHDFITEFFVYVPYLFITLGMTGAGLILFCFNRPGVKERTECGAAPIKARLLSLTLAVLVFGLMEFALVFAIAGIASKGAIFTDVRLPYFMANIGVMLLFGLSLAILTGTISSNLQTVTGLTNVLSLALCFLGGTFVPVQFFTGGVERVARFTPVYWYTVNNAAIGAISETSEGIFTDFLPQLGVVGGYALVVFAAAVVCIYHKRRRAA